MRTLATILAAGFLGIAFFSMIFSFVLDDKFQEEDPNYSSVFYSNLAQVLVYYVILAGLLSGPS